MKRFTLTDRLRYKFDTMMSRGPVSLILWLFIASLVWIGVVSLFAYAVRVSAPGEQPYNFWELAWMSLMRTLDAGTMGGDQGWGVRFFMLSITIGGIFVVSMLIGVLTTSIEGKIDDLRKGRSYVVEVGHTVILGWSDQIFSIISELYLKPASDYIESGKPVNFYTIVEAARQRSEVPLGYRLRAEANNPQKSYGVVVNPVKSEMVVYQENDRIIVLAEN